MPGGRCRLRAEATLRQFLSLARARSCSCRGSGSGDHSTAFLPNNSTRVREGLTFHGPFYLNYATVDSGTAAALNVARIDGAPIIVSWPEQAPPSGESRTRRSVDENV